MNAAIETSNPDKLLTKLKNGDDCAFSELVETHWEKIYNRANSLLSNHQDAEEVAQDTFLRARKSIGNFRGDCSISTWLYHIATNLARNKHWYWWRRKRSESVSLDSPRRRKRRHEALRRHRRRRRHSRRGGRIQRIRQNPPRRNRRASEKILRRNQIARGARFELRRNLRRIADKRRNG